MPSSTADHRHDAVPPAPPKPDATKLVSLLLKAIIMTLVTTLFFLLIGLASLLLLPLLLTSLHRHHRRNRILRRHKADRSTVFSPRDVKKLPQFRFYSRLEPSEPETEPEPQPECVICLEGFRQGQWCRRLVGCGHVFHRKCVDTWLVKVAACPTCRTPVRLASDDRQ